MHEGLCFTRVLNWQNYLIMNAYNLLWDLYFKELYFSSVVVILVLHMYFVCNQGCLDVNLQEWLKNIQVCNGLTF
jgi:hypothetical protein